MIKINTTGTTEMDDGRVLGLNHVFHVADDAVELLVAAQAKVGWRPSGKKMTGLKAGDIRELVQKAGSGVYSYPGSSFAGPFVSHLQAIISIPFCVAATVLGRPVDSVALYAKHYDDPEVGELAKKIKLVEEPQRARPRTEVYTGDGRVLSAEEDPLNLEALSPSRKNMEKRFLAKAPALVGDKKAREIIRLVSGLEQTADIRELTAKL